MNVNAVPVELSHRVGDVHGGRLVRPSHPSSTAVVIPGCTLHVHKITTDGCDLADGLGDMFSVYGRVVSCKILHRADDGGDTSWLVTMDSPSAADAALRATITPDVGTQLRITRHEAGTAKSSRKASSSAVVQRNSRLPADGTALPDNEIRLRSVDIDKRFVAFWFAPGGTTFAAGAKEIYFYDMRSAHKKLAAARKSMVYACSCSPDGRLMCIGDEEGYLAVYCIHDATSSCSGGEHMLWEKRLESSVTDAVFSHDGTWIVTITHCGRACVHDVADPSFNGEHILERHGMPFHANGRPNMGGLAVSEKCLAVAGGKDSIDGDQQDSLRVGLWSVPDFVELAAVELVNAVSALNAISSVAFRADGSALAVGTYAGTVRCYPVIPDSMNTTRLLRGGQEVLLRKVHDDSRVIFWRNRTSKFVPGGQLREVNALAFSNTPGCARAVEDGEASHYCSHCGRCHRPRWLLAAGFETGDFFVYDSLTTARIASFTLDRSSGTVCEFSPDDSTLAVGGGGSQQIILHRLAPASPTGRFALSRGKNRARLTELKIVHDDAPLITSCCVSTECIALVDQSRIEIYDRLSSRLICTILADINDSLSPTSLRELQSERRQFSNSTQNSDPTIKASVCPVSLQPFGKYVACVLSSRTVLIYELPSGALALQLGKYVGEVSGVGCEPAPASHFCMVLTSLTNHLTPV